jgi:ATP-dependent DNA helicase RecQ
VLKGQLQVELYPPERDDASTAKTPAPSSLSPLERELSGALRALRSSLAKAQAVPPFVVFSDASLEDMARRKPITLEAFAEVEGAGKAKQEKYGGAFVKEIYSFLNSRGLLSLGTTYGSAPPASPKPHRLDLTPTVLETERLLAEGHTLDSIAELRGISTSAIAEHITRLLEHNHPVDIWKHITPSQLEAVRPHLPLYTAEKRLKPIFDALGGELNYGQIRLALAWLQKQGVNL